MARKNVHLDRAQTKAKKQKRLAIILCGVLALILVYEVPHTMKLMHPAAKAPVVETSASAPAAPNPVSTTQSPANGPPAASPAPSPSTPAQSIISFVQPQADPGQLTEFANFASKDPFIQSVQKTGGSPAASSTTKSSAGSTKKSGTGTPPKTPPAPPPSAAVISVNGELMNVQVGSDFPTAGVIFSQVGAPLFHLLSLTQKTAKVTIAGGSYANGASALTLTVGQPVTLQNTADGTRYTLLLEPQGTQVPASTTPGSTTPAATTPTTTTPSVVPSSSG